MEYNIHRFNARVPYSECVVVFLSIYYYYIWFFFVSWNRVAPEGYVLYITTHNEVSLLLPVCISVVSKHKPICLLSETAGWRNGRTRFLVFLLNKADGSFSCKMNALTLKAKKCKKINSPSGYDILLY